MVMLFSCFRTLLNYVFKNCFAAVAEMVEEPLQIVFTAVKDHRKVLLG